MIGKHEGSYRDGIKWWERYLMLGPLWFNLSRDRHHYAFTFIAGRLQMRWIWSDASRS
jgi:hypothetical protein